MWEPRYDREGLPFTPDEASPLTPRGQLEAERRFLMGLGRAGRRGRIIAMLMLVVILGLIAVSAVNIVRS